MLDDTDSGDKQASVALFLLKITTWVMRLILTAPIVVQHNSVDSPKILASSNVWCLAGVSAGGSASIWAFTGVATTCFTD